MGTTNVSRLPRNPGPYSRERSCRNCGASPLSSYNPSDICAPCNKGDWEEGGSADGASTTTVTQLRAERREELGIAA